MNLTFFTKSDSSANVGIELFMALEKPRPLSEDPEIFLGIVKSVISDATSEANPVLHFYSLFSPLRQRYSTFSDQDLCFPGNTTWSNQSQRKGLLLFVFVVMTNQHNHMYQSSSLYNMSVLELRFRFCVGFWV